MNLPWREDKIQVISGLDSATSAIYEPILSRLQRVEDRLLTLRNDSLPDLELLIKHILNSGGKRVRPAVTLLASSVHEEQSDTSVTMAAAIELLHIATLIHDDTVDDAETRRGVATVSQKWGSNIAVLFGDYVFATSATWVCETENVKVIRRFSETIMELASGQISEFFSSFDAFKARSDYEDRIYRKTASLFCTAGETGAILGSAPEQSIQSLRSYGYSIGMAFQIMDDVLDFEGNSDHIGKPVGSDLCNGVLTLPSITFLEKYPDNNPVRKWFSDARDPEQLKLAIDMIMNSDAIADCYGVIQKYCASAQESLRELPKGPSTESLSLLTEYIMSRTK